MRRMNQAVVRIPGTTSNLGPGFDALGIALNIYNEVRVTRAGSSGVEITSPLSERDRAGAVAMLDEAANTFFSIAGVRSFGLKVSLQGDVPIARGLGSSVTARLGVVAGLDAICGTGFSRMQLLDAVTELEHHPDNAAPAILGGFTIAGMAGGNVRALSFRVSPALRFVTLIPNFEVSTAEARKLVPNQFSKADAIHNLNRAAFISACFASRAYEGLKGMFDDRIHQPYRQKLIPQLSKVIEAGERAGAVGGWLSGSGSTIICLTSEKAELVGRAMLKALPDAAVRILKADNRGCRVF